MDTRLKSCPFCGGYADLNVDIGEWWGVECEGCGAKYDDWKTSNEAVAAWNLRASPWISVEERLPEELPFGQYRKVLTHCSGLVREASWLFGGFHLRHDGCSEIHPEHWAELPAPPESDNHPSG